MWRSVPGCGSAGKAARLRDLYLHGYQLGEMMKGWQPRAPLLEVSQQGSDRKGWSEPWLCKPGEPWVRAGNRSASECVAGETGKGPLSIFGFQNLERKLRNQKRLGKNAKKRFKGWSRCFAVRNLNSSVWFVCCKGGGEVTCLQAGCTSAEGECWVERAW